MQDIIQKVATGSTVTIPNIILSIVNTKDTAYITSKVDTLPELLKLNEVEKRILEDIDSNLFIANPLSISYLKEKYSYYFNADFGKYLDKEGIDNAVHAIRYEQSKNALAHELVNLGSKISTLAPSEIRKEFKKISDTNLPAHAAEIPENDFVREDDAYADLVSSGEGMSLVLSEIEKYAGKATLGTVVSILAYTGSFKSTYALNVAYQNTLKGYNVLYLTLESTGKKLIQRLVLNHIASTVTDRTQLITSSAIRDKKLNKAQQKFYNEMHNDLFDKIGKHLIMWDSAKIQYQGFDDMTTTLRNADNKFKEDTGKGLDAIVLDQLSLLKYTQAAGKKYGYDGAVMNDWVIYFEKQALNFLDEGRKTTVFLVSQIGREAYKEASKPKNKGRYTASAPQDSNEIEKTSTTMITLYKDLSTANTLLVGIPKAREGEVTDDPIVCEVYGEYYHIGSLNIGNIVTTEDFEKPTFSLKDLIK